MSEFAEWDSFYVIVGSAAGALIGLQFVVLTLIAERPPLRAADAGARSLRHGLAPVGDTARSMASGHARGGALGLCGPQRRRLHRYRGSPHAHADGIPTRAGGLVISLRAAVGRVLDTGAFGIRGSLSHPRGLVRR